MTSLRNALRRLAAAGGLLLLVTVFPAGLVLGTQAFPWPDGLRPPPLNTGLGGEFAWPHFHTWLADTYQEVRLQLTLDDLVMLVCLLALWICWTILICLLLADTTALIRYGAHRLRAEGPHGARGWITALVTSTVLVSTASPSLASALPHNPVAASAPRHPGGPQRVPDAPRTVPATDGLGSGPSVAGSAVYVHRGDSLWSLATDHLGDGHRWREITDFNPHLSPQPQFLRAGQWLHMPHDAVRLQPPPVPREAQWITVADGDTLTSLAEKHLGNPERWRELYDLNRGRTQPDDRTLRTPELLMPGWRFAIPLATTPEPSEPETGHARNPVTAPAPEAPPAVHRTPARPSPSSAPNEPAPNSQPPVRVVAGVVVGLAVAGTLTAAAFRWRRRRTPRPPTEPLPAVYPLPMALDRTGNLPDPGDDEDDEELLRTDLSPGFRVAAQAEHRPVEHVSRESVPDRGARSAPPEAANTEQGPGSVWGLEKAVSAPAVYEPMITEPAEPAHTAQLRLTVFGSVRLCRPANSDNTEVEVSLQPRMRALLAFLTLHPHGAIREELLDALWGANSGTSALNTTVSRLRRTLTRHHNVSGDLVTAHDGRYRLNPDLTTVDYWEFTTTLEARRRATTDHERAAADEQLIAAYNGEFSAGLDAPWAEPARAHAHRAFLDAITARTQALQPTEPQRVLGMLEDARDVAQYHEPLYRNIMRLQAHLGFHESIPATLSLVRARLADIGSTPDQHTRALAEKLRHRPADEDGHQ